MRKSGQKMKPEAPEMPEWMKRALECPVCLEIIIDPPIYVCENPQGHSVCSTCHESLLKDGKTCPLCRCEMNNRRNVTMEGMLDNNPNKVKCKFDGCDFKRSDREAIKKHEDVCEKRYVPCAFCDDKIGLKGLAEHVIQKHADGNRFQTNDVFWTKMKDCRKGQTVVEDKEGLFVTNWCTLDEVSKLFWVAYIGPNDSSPPSYKYTLQVWKSKDKKEESLFEGTRHCIPCDLSHEDMKKKRWALMLDKDLVDDATKGNEGNKLYYSVAIYKV